jgi:hypothetical protein
MNVAMRRPELTRPLDGLLLVRVVSFVSGGRLAQDEEPGLCGGETGGGMEGMNARRVIKGIEEFITAVREDSSAWKSEEPKWFRGEPESTTALVPTLYRPGPTQHENAELFRCGRR